MFQRELLVKHLWEDKKEGLKLEMEQMLEVAQIMREIWLILLTPVNFHILPTVHSMMNLQWVLPSQPAVIQINAHFAIYIWAVPTCTSGT